MKKLFTNILVLFFLLIAGEICRSQSFYEALWQGNIEIVQDTLNKHPELANQIGNYGLSPIQVVISWGSANHKQLIEKQ